MVKDNLKELYNISNTSTASILLDKLLEIYPSSELEELKNHFDRQYNNSIKNLSFEEQTAFFLIDFTNKAFDIDIDNIVLKKKSKELIKLFKIISFLKVLYKTSNNQIILKHYKNNIYKFLNIINESLDKDYFEELIINFIKEIQKLNNINKVEI